MAVSHKLEYSLAFLDKENYFRNGEKDQFYSKLVLYANSPSAMVFAIPKRK